MSKRKNKSRLNDYPNQQFFQSHINKHEERKDMIWRFDDFTEAAQIKLCVMLKTYSRCYTVKKDIDIKEIYHALRVSNPILIKNFGRGFYSGQMPAWREKELSRVVYYLCRRNANEKTKQAIVEMIETENRNDNYYNRTPEPTMYTLSQLAERLNLSINPSYAI